MSEIINKIAESGLITLDMERYLPAHDTIAGIDLSTYLFKGLLLREKDFRASLPEQDWTTYQDKYVAIYCSTDAIIPMWAYMLLATYLAPIAKGIYFGNEEYLNQQVLIAGIQAIDAEEYVDKRVIIKGCADRPLGENAYIKISEKLLPVVKTLMYGEPCSTVPIYKKKKEAL